MATPAGEFNRRVALERKIAVDDGAGGRRMAWQAIAYPWVKASPIGGKEALAAGTLQAQQNWRVVMRRRDVRTEDRLRPIRWREIYDPEVRLNIRSAADTQGDRAELVLLCDTGKTA